MAGVHPIGHIYIVFRQHALNRAAQQCCKVAGHGGNQQNFLLRGGKTDFAKMQHATKRLLPHHMFFHINQTIGGECVIDVKCLLVVPACQAFEHVQ